MKSLQNYKIGQKVTVHNLATDPHWQKAFFGRVIAWDVDSITVRDDDGDVHECDPSDVSAVRYSTIDLFE